MTRRERAEALHNALGLSEWYDGYRDRVDAIDRALQAVERDALERAARVVDEIAERAIGRAAAPIDLPWVANRIRALAKETL